MQKFLQKTSSLPLTQLISDIPEDTSTLPRIPISHIITTTEDVESTIKKIPRNKAPGPDAIPNAAPRNFDKMTSNLMGGSWGAA